MIDRLDGLRHDAVVGGNDQHDDIRHLGAAGAHGGERLVARRIDERDLLAVGSRHLIGADVLRDATGLAAGNVGLADRIQQRGLAVIDVAHDGHDRSAQLQMLVGVLGADEAFLDVGFRNAFHLVAELGDQQLGGIGIQNVGDLVQRALLHQQANDVDTLLRHAVGQLLDRDDLGDDDLAHDFLARLLHAAALPGFTLALAPERGERPFALLVVEQFFDREAAAGAPLLGLDRP